MNLSDVAAVTCDEAAIERVEQPEWVDSLALACQERDSARRWARSWKTVAKDKRNQVGAWFNETLDLHVRAERAETESVVLRERVARLEEVVGYAQEWVRAKRERGRVYGSPAYEPASVPVRSAERMLDAALDSLDAALTKPREGEGAK